MDKTSRVTPCTVRFSFLWTRKLYSLLSNFARDGPIYVEIELANSITINGDAPIQITERHRVEAGTQLRIAEPTGQTAVIEGSSDLQTWIELKSIFVPNAGVIEFTDETAPPSGRFYRLRAQ